MLVGSLLVIDNQFVEWGNGEIVRVMLELCLVVVMVLIECGFGIGFYIGSFGWLLINQYVIGQVCVVWVCLLIGWELFVEVVWVDVVCDIVLFKIEVLGVWLMLLCMGELGIGEDVYVLGLLLGDVFNIMFMCGIFSGVCKVCDLDFLQSDVVILLGSSGGFLLDKLGQVIGIIVVGLGVKGLVGMNFFILVGSVIECL